GSGPGDRGVVDPGGGGAGRLDEVEEGGEIEVAWRDQRAGLAREQVRMGAGREPLPPAPARGLERPRRDRRQDRKADALEGPGDERRADHLPGDVVAELEDAPTPAPRDQRDREEVARQREGVADGVARAELRED